MYTNKKCSSYLNWSWLLIIVVLCISGIEFRNETKTWGIALGIIGPHFAEIIIKWIFLNESHLIVSHIYKSLLWGA